MQARAIGDADVGSFISAEPFTQTIEIPAGCERATFVVASDGVWDALPGSAAKRVRSATHLSLEAPLHHPTTTMAERRGYSS
eukprot:scaffold292375_cov33-Tisochrysis_lutea.AAC.2